MIVELEAFRPVERSGRSDETDGGSERRGLRLLDDFFRGRPPPSWIPGGGVGRGGWYSGWNLSLSAFLLAALEEDIPPEPMKKSSVPKSFIPSTNASMVSTPCTGAATTTGKGSTDIRGMRKSIGVWGGVSI